MINQLEIPMYLTVALPEIKNDLQGKKNNLFELINTLFAFTCGQIQAHNFSAVKRCFKLADKLYSKGNKTVKSAIENSFVYSFTKMFLSYPEEKQQLLALMPISLYTLYIGQVCHNGC